MLFDVILWLLAFELFGLIAFPLLARIFPELPDKGYSISKVVGFGVFGYLSWAIPWFTRVPFSQPVLLAIAGVLLGFALLYVNRVHGGYERLFLSKRQEILFAELAFLACYVLFLFIRSFQPEIFWGEKPMDFSFLNLLIRTEDLPPIEPWASGFYLRYYYLGTYFFAAVHKLTSINSSIGYNLSIAMLAALFLSTAVGVSQFLIRNIKWAIFSGVSVTLLANAEVLLLTLYKKQEIGFDLFWASSRIHTSPAFAEYPLWTFIFADLHAHAMALPFSILLVGFALALFQARLGISQLAKDDSAQLCFRVMYGSLAGVIFAINGWDLITQFALFLLVVLSSHIVESRDGVLRYVKEKFSAVFYDLVIVITSALIVLVPFKFSQGDGPGLYIGWVLGSFSKVDQIFRHLGHFLVPLSAVLIAFLTRTLLHPKKGERIKFILSWLIASVPFVLGFIVSRQSGLVESVPWGVLALSSAILLFGVRALLDQREDISSIGLLVSTCGAMLCATELVFVMDRMNTIFKFYHPIWQMMGLASFASVYCMQSKFNTLKKRLLISFVPILCLLIAIVGSVIDIWGMLKFHRVNGPRPTLNGVAYLNELNQDEALLYAWINENIDGVPVLLESHGNSYAQYTRVCMNTGLPTVLGWDYHVHQRGVTDQEIAQRKTDIKQLYSTSDAAVAATIIDKYKIEYIVVGAVELDEYEHGVYLKSGLLKFNSAHALFKPVFRSGVVTLYATPLAKKFKIEKGRI